MEKILVIEDSRVFLKYMNQLLEKNGFEIIECKDPSLAIELAREFKPSCIFTDFEMPNIKGDDLCRMFKAEDDLSHIPIVMLTSKTGDESLISAITKGADDFLLKTSSEEVVIIKLRNMLRLKSLQEEQITLKQLEAVRGMIATYNHEINNIVTINLGYIEKISDISSNNAAILEINEKLKNGMLRISNIVKSLRDIKVLNTEVYSNGIDMIKIDKKDGEISRLIF